MRLNVFELQGGTGQRDGVECSELREPHDMS